MTRIDAEARRVHVGDATALDCAGARIAAVHWVAGAPPDAPVRARVQVRHRHGGASATLACTPDGGVDARFDAPVRAVTPGQAAVFYADACDDPRRGDVVLGGGFIERAMRGPLA